MGKFHGRGLWLVGLAVGSAIGAWRGARDPHRLVELATLYGAVGVLIAMCLSELFAPDQPPSGPGN
jgi:ABC-type Fe3+-siderophore transport system permease subunit